MAIITRRNLLKTGAAAAALPLIGSRAFAQEKLKVGFIFLGPIGDYGWTWAHNKGREAADAAVEMARLFANIGEGPASRGYGGTGS